MPRRATGGSGGLRRPRCGPSASRCHGPPHCAAGASTARPACPDVAVDLGGFALDLQSHLLAQRASQVAHHARHAAQAIAEGAAWVGRPAPCGQALRQMPHAPAELGRPCSASSRSDCSTMRASSSAACTRASTSGRPAPRARRPALPGTACMRRSRSMDALNGAIQCDSTSVSLDSPSSLFKVSAVTQHALAFGKRLVARPPQRRRLGRRWRWTPGRRSGGRKSDGRSAAAQAMIGRVLARCSALDQLVDLRAQLDAGPRAAAGPCPAAARRYRWPQAQPASAATRQSSIACAMRTAGCRSTMRAAPFERMRRAHAGSSCAAEVGRAPAPGASQHLHLGGQLEQFQQGRVSHLVRVHARLRSKRLHQQGFIQDAHAAARHTARVFQAGARHRGWQGSSRSRSTE